MNNNLTEKVIVLDRSGSMSSCQADMEGGLNTYIDEQRKIAGEVRITYVRFDTEIEVVVNNAPIKDVGTLRLEPRGGTALYDAIGVALKTVGNRLATTPENERPGLVDVIIVTDGGENSSREYNAETIKQMIETQQNVFNWKFTYLGANQNAFAVGDTLGFAASSVANYNTKNAKKMFENVSARSSRMYAAAATNDSYALERATEYSTAERGSM